MTNCFAPRNRVTVFRDVLRASNLRTVLASRGRVSPKRRHGRCWTFRRSRAGAPSSCASILGRHGRRDGNRRQGATDSPLRPVPMSSRFKRRFHPAVRKPPSLRRIASLDCGSRNWRAVFEHRDLRQDTNALDLRNAEVFNRTCSRATIRCSNSSTPHRRRPARSAANRRGSRFGSSRSRWSERRLEGPVDDVQQNQERKARTGYWAR